MRNRARLGKLYGQAARRAETRRQAAAKMRARGMTQAQIGEVLGVTRERARQLILEASR